MNHAILCATSEDLPMVMHLFDQAIQYQKVNNYIGWANMDERFIEADINHGLLYKVQSGDMVLGIFCICFTDQLIWREREKGDAIYLHRIVLNRANEGVKLFETVFEWATDEARRRHLRYVRMDTWAGNLKLIDYYRGYGFKLIENYTTEDTLDLPVQHRNLHVALLEYQVT